MVKPPYNLMPNYKITNASSMTPIPRKKKKKMIKQQWALVEKYIKNNIGHMLVQEHKKKEYADDHKKRMCSLEKTILRYMLEKTAIESRPEPRTNTLKELV